MVPERQAPQVAAFWCLELALFVAWRLNVARKTAAKKQRMKRRRAVSKPGIQGGGGPEASEWMDVPLCAGMLCRIPALSVSRRTGPRAHMRRYVVLMKDQRDPGAFAKRI